MKTVKTDMRATPPQIRLESTLITATMNSWCPLMSVCKALTGTYATAHVLIPVHDANKTATPFAKTLLHIANKRPKTSQGLKASVSFA